MSDQEFRVCFAVQKTFGTIQLIKWLLSQFHIDSLRVARDAAEQLMASDEWRNLEAAKTGGGNNG